MSASYDPTAQMEVRVFDVPYLHHGDTPYLATVYQPQGPGLFPALINIHGGRWNRGSRGAQELFNRAIATSGAVVVAVDFRVAPEYPYPAQVIDANYAIRWLKAHAAELNALADNIGCMGASSGAHTMMLNALGPRDPVYTALPLAEAPETEASLAYAISLSGVLDSYARYQYAKRTGRAGLVQATESYFLSEDRIREANPQTVLERGEAAELPPLLIIQGTKDDNVPNEIPERFAQIYQERGGHIELEWFPDSPHQIAKGPGPQTERAVGLMKQFIARQLAALGTRSPV